MDIVRKFDAFEDFLFKYDLYVITNNINKIKHQN